MSDRLLAPLGRAEPDDLQGWLEQGGLLRLQLARRWTAQRRRRLLAALDPVPDQPHVLIRPGPSPDVARLLLYELPAWLLEGALLLAHALDQPRVTLYLDGVAPDLVGLLDSLVARLSALGITGPAGWLQTEVDIKQGSREGLIPDALDAFLLTARVKKKGAHTSTLLAIDGAVARPGVYEVARGPTARALLEPHVAGGWAGAEMLVDGRATEETMLDRPLDGRVRRIEIARSEQPVSRERAG